MTFEVAGVFATASEAAARVRHHRVGVQVVGLPCSPPLTFAPQRGASGVPSLPGVRRKLVGFSAQPPWPCRLLRRLKPLRAVRPGPGSCDAPSRGWELCRLRSSDRTPLMGLSMISPPPTWASCVHSRSRPPEEGPSLRPGLATSRTRSVLVVPPDFDGLLRTSSCRSVAPCSRPWGSPSFWYVHLVIPAHDPPPGAGCLHLAAANEPRPSQVARQRFPRQVTIRLVPGLLVANGSCVLPRSRLPPPPGLHHPSCWGDASPRLPGVLPCALPHLAGPRCRRHRLPRPRRGRDQSRCRRHPLWRSTLRSFSLRRQQRRVTATLALPPLVRRQSTVRLRVAAHRVGVLVCFPRPQGLAPPASPLRREVLPPRIARCSHGLALSSRTAPRLRRFDEAAPPVATRRLRPALLPRG